MKKWTVLALALGLGSSSVSCSRSGEPRQPAPHPASEYFLAVANTAAPGDATPAPAPDAPLAPLAPLAPKDRYYVALRKAALGQPFLLHGAMIPQTGAPTGHSLKGRIVSFRRAAEKIYLVESSAGQVVTDDLPSSLILAEIPILRESDDAIVLDFNAGATQIFLAGNYYASDENGKSYEDDGAAVRVSRGFIESVRTRGEYLEIRQVAQVETPSEHGVTLRAYEVRYFLSAYAPNPAFAPRETSDFKWVGFFETQPRLELGTGRSLIRIGRWDIAKPVEYRISANTPPEYAEAVRQGVLYWNSAFGREIVRVADAPAGYTAPDPEYNIIQWVPNDSAGSAYAEMLMDPTNGEIRHAQVYLTSVFAVSSRSRAASFLRNLKSIETRGNSPVEGSPRNDGRLCDLSPADSGTLGPELATLLESGADDDAFLRISRDYVRFVVAHEVGHTLGLRHQFAGSLGTNVTTPEREELFRTYLAQGRVPDSSKVFTTSVMEYASLFESILTSSGFNQGHAPLAYDRQAIAWGYFGTPIDTRTAPLYCTDSHVAHFKDCQRFDSGADPVVTNAEAIGGAIKALPVSFAEKFIAARAPNDGRDRKPLEEVALDPAAPAKAMVELLKAQADWLSPDGGASIRIERRFPAAAPFEADRMREARREWVKSQLATLAKRDDAGLGAALFGWLPSEEKPDAPSFAVASTAALAAYLARTDVRTGIGYDGKPYTLSDADVALITELGGRYFRAVEEKFLDLALDALAAAKFDHPALNDLIEARLASIARHIVLTSTKPELRVKGAKLLAKGIGPTLDWNLEARSKLRHQLKLELDHAVEGDAKKTDPATLARPLRRWFVEQVAVIAALAD